MEKLNKEFMDKFGKLYNEEQLNRKDWMKPYPRNEEICNFIKQLLNKAKYKDKYWNIYQKWDWFFTDDEIDRRVKMWDLIEIKYT